MTSEWTKPRPVNTLFNYGIIGTTSILRASSNTAPQPYATGTRDTLPKTEDEVEEVDSQQAVAVDEVVPDIPPNGGDEGSSPVKAPSQERLVDSMSSFTNDLLATFLKNDSDWKFFKYALRFVC